ncbi:hypothetical protein JM93_01474 [Roseibium hamelinense]|uniref:Uncharacterized protein n=1 Tax=Roseibium hamelinense TaxID=150831 RepID=A0A562TA54_9HYPH|nr:hypothetical protein JM93_01474 [Roseibium hamelinense]
MLVPGFWFCTGRAGKCLWLRLCPRCSGGLNRSAASFIGLQGGAATGIPTLFFVKTALRDEISSFLRIKDFAIENIISHMCSNLKSSVFLTHEMRDELSQFIQLGKDFVMKAESLVVRSGMSLRG